MAFYGHPYGVIDFDGSQGTVAGINAYLAAYDAVFNGSTYANAVADYPSEGWGTYGGAIGLPIGSGGSTQWTLAVSSPNVYSGGMANGFKLVFNTPVRAVGMYLSGIYGYPAYYHEIFGKFADNTPFSYRIEDAALADVADFANIDNLLNGFFGLKNDIGISELDFASTHDYTGVDDIYFTGSAVIVPTTPGPKGVPSSEIPDIATPMNPDGPLGHLEEDVGGEVPEPSTLLLLLPLIAAGIWRMRKK
ncbi:MAG TPA: PEP-CTERM sorting domain-containing protein [bacterium]|nr:PEP-CTERM sorting domain-containing protein [bacterium]